MHSECSYIVDYFFLYSSAYLPTIVRVMSIFLVSRVQGRSPPTTFDPSLLPSFFVSATPELQPPGSACVPFNIP